MQAALQCSAGAAAVELRARQQSGAQASTALPAPAPRLARRAAGPQRPCRLGAGSGGSRRGRLSITAAIKKNQEKHVVCHKTVVAKPDKVAKVAEMCKDVMDFSQGRASQRSNGIMDFRVIVDQFEPNVFYFWERYDGNASMGRHNTCPELKAFMENIQEHLEGPVGLALYEWQDGKIGNACIQGGPKGEGGLDDAPGAGGSGGASHKQTSNTLDLGNVQRGEEGDSFGLGKKIEGFKLPWMKKKEEAKKE